MTKGLVVPNLPRSLWMIRTTIRLGLYTVGTTELLKAFEHGGDMENEYL